MPTIKISASSVQMLPSPIVVMGWKEDWTGYTGCGWVGVTDYNTNPLVLVASNVTVAALKVVVDQTIAYYNEINTGNRTISATVE